jgi:hypothetical protein
MFVNNPVKTAYISEAEFLKIIKEAKTNKLIKAINTFHTSGLPDWCLEKMKEEFHQRMKRTA